MFGFRFPQQRAVAESFCESFRPANCGAWLGVVTITEAVTGIGEQVQFGGNFGCFVFEVQTGHPLGDVRVVVNSRSDEDWRHPGFDGEAAGTSRINEGLKTGRQLDIRRVLLTGIVFHRGIRREFASGSDAKESHAVGHEMPLGSAIANQPQSTPRVRHHMILNRVSTRFLASEPELQHERCNASTRNHSASA